MFTVTATNGGSGGTGPAASPSNTITAVVSPCTLLGTRRPARRRRPPATPTRSNSASNSRADIDGFITGIRFYKSAANTGTHTGTLWTSTGTLLATVTFTSETATGWQQAASPTPSRHRRHHLHRLLPRPQRPLRPTNNGFGTALDNPPLHAPATGATPNGLYLLLQHPRLPHQTWQGSNYWVDVTFTT